MYVAGGIGKFYMNVIKRIYWKIMMCHMFIGDGWYSLH